MYLKPFLTLVLAVLFALLSLVILYAQIANVFGFQHNLIYDVVEAPNIDPENPGYFFLFNVRLCISMIL